MKLMNSYKLVSFNVLVTMHIRCHTFTKILINLCYLKTYELKALNCYFGQQVLFHKCI
ncbi:hypothetical protein BHL51_05035 [Bacillus cereus]|nr:hypothetical protein BHL51_05035 [Bacillus cereus]